MSTPNKSQAEAKQAARDDAKPTGPAGIPGTEPAPKTRAKMTDAERAKKEEASREHNIDLIQQRTELAIRELTGKQGSLADRIRDYKNVPDDIVDAAIATVRDALATCEAAAEARKSKPEDSKFNLRVRAAMAKQGQ